MQMDQEATGAIIRQRREALGITQAELAQRLSVTDKSVSKWETGRGWPDITLIPALSEALGLSLTELLGGRSVANVNRSFNMLRCRFYVCPVCGNVLTATGEAVVSCCGVTLLPQEAEEPDEAHEIHVALSDGDYDVTVAHDMSKTHSISFIAAVTDQGIQLVKLYPEGEARARFPVSRVRYLYAYCNRHGLFRVKAGVR